MKVLLMSVTAGQGHNSTCRATADELTAMGATCETMDTLQYISRTVATTVDRGYVYMTLLTPGAFGALYNTAERQSAALAHTQAISRLAGLLITDKLIRAVQDAQADVIICSHPFSALFASHMVQKGLINTPTVGILTDFTVHPYWEHTQLDLYVTASSQLNYVCQKRGIPAQKLMPTGIPVQEKFSVRRPKAQVRAELGLADKPTLLIMSGSIGFSSTVDVVKTLEQVQTDFQVVTVCGNNQRIKKKIDTMAPRCVAINYGFTTNVDQLMDAADALLTKPGGLTSSEALTKRLPLLLFSPIPGQEDRNMEFLLNHGMAMALTDFYPIDEALHQLMFNPDRLRLMRECQSSFAPTNAARSLAQEIFRRWGDKAQPAMQEQAVPTLLS